MLKIRFTNKMKKDVKRIKKQPNSGYDEKEFETVVLALAKREPLDEKYLDHPLHGKFEGAREFHLRPDLLVIYEIREEVLELIMMRMGSHSDVLGR